MSIAFTAALALSGLLAGFVHVVSGPDHVAAIAPFAVRAKARAWRTGVRWGLGHSAGVLGVGVLALVLRDALNIELVSGWSERFVGVILLAIGAWGLFTVASAPTLSQCPDRGLAHRHEHPAFAVGTVHGLAGSSHLLGIIPALALPSDLAAGVYLLFFGFGSISAMGAFSSVVGWAAGMPSISGARLQSVLLGAFSLPAIIVGVVWLLSPFRVS